MTRIDLPDINVWIALTVPAHVHRSAAEVYWRTDALPRVAFNTTTMLGFIRVSSSAALFEGLPISTSDAWEVLVSWMSRREIGYLAEPRTCRTLFESFVAAGLVTAGTVTDAYLASFAISAGARLVTFDRDFQRFPGLELALLS